jgi:di/tricarboxylate transporter
MDNTIQGESAALSGSEARTETKKRVRKALLWIFTFGTPVIFLLLPLGIDTVTHRFLAITIWAVLAWVTLVIPTTATGLALPVLYFFCNIAPAKVAFSTWGNAIVWNTIAVIMVGTACDKSGLSKRFAYALLLKMNCTIKGLIWGFATCGIVLAFVISDSFSRMIIFTTIAIGICRALDIPMKSKEATGLGLAAFFAMSGPSIGIFTASNGLLMNTIYRDIADGELTYIDWTLHNFLPAVAWTLLSVFVMIKILKIGKDSGSRDARDVLLAHKRELGKIGFREIMVLIILVFIVVNYIFFGRFGIDPLIVPALLIPFFFLPKVGILSGEDFDSVDAKVLFVITGAMSIGSVASDIGLVEVFVDKIGPVIASSPFVMVLGTFILGCIMNFVLTPLAIVFTFTEAFTRMAIAADVNPLPVMYALNFSADVYIFPYEFVIFLVCMSFGLMNYKDVIKVMTGRFALAFVILLVVCIPTWKLFGIM